MVIQYTLVTLIDYCELVSCIKVVGLRCTSCMLWLKASRFDLVEGFRSVRWTLSVGGVIKKVF
jgi:hypothetical protein